MIIEKDRTDCTVVSEQVRLSRSVFCFAPFMNVDRGRAWEAHCSLCRADGAMSMRCRIDAKALPVGSPAAGEAAWRVHLGPSSSRGVTSSYCTYQHPTCPILRSANRLSPHTNAMKYGTPAVNLAMHQAPTVPSSGRGCSDTTTLALCHMQSRKNLPPIRIFSPILSPSRPLTYRYSTSSLLISFPFPICLKCGLFLDLPPSINLPMR